jgi:hypothetical protein
MVENSEQIDLPPAGTVAWGNRRKAAVVLAVRAGQITRDEAYSRYRLSPEELVSWEAAFDRGGHKALMSKASLPRRKQ